MNKAEEKKVSCFEMLVWGSGAEQQGGEEMNKGSQASIVWGALRAKALGNKQRDPFGEAQEAAPAPDPASLTVHE